jgi:hypothetical protein
MQPKNLSLATSPPKSSALPEPWIERLFARFEAMYGARFADAWKGCSIAHVKAVWAEDLGGFSRDELAAGIAGCRSRDWPPTLPEFMKLCRPPIDHQAALLEAIEQMARRESGRDRWSHPAIYWAAVKIGAYDLGRKTLRDLDAEWRKAFGDQMALGQWPEIPERLPALPAPGQTHSREVWKETIQAMLARLKSAAEAHCKASDDGA